MMMNVDINITAELEVPIMIASHGRVAVLIMIASHG